MVMTPTLSLPQKMKEGIASKKRRVLVMIMTTTLSLPKEKGWDSFCEEEGCMVMTLTLAILVIVMATILSLAQKRKEGIASKKRRVVVMVMTTTPPLPEAEGWDSLFYEEEACMVMATLFLLQKEVKVKVTFGRGRRWPWQKAETRNGDNV